MEKKYTLIPGNYQKDITSSYVRSVDLPEIISSYYPSLEKDIVSKVAVHFTGLCAEELSMVLEAGTKILKTGKKALIAYLKAAPAVHGLTDEKEFKEWLATLREVAGTGVFCTEGFLKNSVIIIKTGSVQRLKIWANTGLLLAKNNKTVAISYFRNSGQTFASTDLKSFEELVREGERFTSLKVQL